MSLESYPFGVVSSQKRQAPRGDSKQGSESSREPMASTSVTVFVGRLAKLPLPLRSTEVSTQGRTRNLVASKAADQSFCTTTWPGSQQVLPAPLLPHARPPMPQAMTRAPAQVKWIPPRPRWHGHGVDQAQRRSLPTVRRKAKPE